MYPQYTLKGLAKRKARTAGVVLTIAILTAMMIFVTAFMGAYSTAIYLPFKDIDANLVLQRAGNATPELGAQIRAPFGKSAFPSDTADSISALPHVQGISKSLVVWYFKKDGFSTVEGVEPASALGNKLASWVTGGRFLSGTDGRAVVLESHYAKFNHETVGDSISLGNETFQVVGILKTQEGGQVFASNIYTTLPEAQRISNIGSYNKIYVKLDGISSEDSVKSEISRLDSSITILSGSAISPSVNSFAAIYGQFYFVGIGILSAIAILILAKITTMDLLERRKEIAVMQTVGWRRRDIVLQIAAELSVQVLAGFAIGVVFALAMAASMGSIHIQGAQAGLEQPVDLSAPLMIIFDMVFWYFLLIVAISAVVVFALARQLAAIRPMENFRSV